MLGGDDNILKRPWTVPRDMARGCLDRPSKRPMIHQISSLSHGSFEVVLPAVIYPSLAYIDLIICRVALVISALG